MRPIDYKKLLSDLETLAKWFDPMAAMTRDQDMRRRHKYRAKAVRKAIELLEETDEPNV